MCTFVVKYRGQDQPASAIKMFQISPCVSYFQILKQLRNKIYFKHIYNFLYRLHITQNDKEKKILVKLLLHVVHTNFCR